MEIEKGIRLIKKDRAKFVRLSRWYEEMVIPSFEGRILDITASVASEAARILSTRPRNLGDALIAATAVEHGMTIVTRNSKDFEGIGIDLIDPWTDT